MSMRLMKVATVVAVVLLLATPTWASNWRAELGAEPALVEEEDSGGIVGRSAWPGPDGGLRVGSMCTYSWIDITTTGTLTDQLGDDTVVGPYPIGFPISHYGNLFTDFYVSSNGYIELGDNYSTLSNQCPLPNSSAPNNVIALMWDDLDPGDTLDPVYYQTFAAGLCPWGGYAGACLVVTYDDFCHYPGGASCAIAGTWQAIIFDDSAIVMQYLDPGVESGLSATLGIEGDDAASDHGLTYVCNVTDPTLANACHMYAPPPPVPVLAGSVKAASPSNAMPGQTVTYTIDINNNGTGDALAATLVDPIPMGMTYAGGLFCTTGSCSYDGGAGEVLWAGTVAAMSSETVAFDVTVDSGAPCGVPIVNSATIDDPGLLTGSVLVEAEVIVWDAVPFFTDLEADDGGFVAGQGEWEWGIPTYPPDLVAQGAHSGVNVWGTDLDFEADDTLVNHILSLTVDVPFTLPGYAAELQWWDWWGDEASDYRQIWIDGVLMFEFPTGHQRVWTAQSFDLSPWAGQTITIDFNLEVCCAGAGPDGWYIDDIGIAVCLPPAGLYLSPDVVTALGCNGIPQLHTFNLSNITGGDATFTMTYDNPTMNASVAGPPDITLIDGTGTNFDVELIPDLCLGDGELVTVEITADGNMYSDMSTINKTIGAPPAGWTAIASEPDNGRMDNVVGEYNGLLWSITGYGDNADVRTYDVGTDTWTVVGTAPSFGVNYSRSGCFAGNTVYVYGDAATAGYTGLWSYNMDTGVWTNLSPTGTPPATTGIWAPSWVFNPADGYCYMTGGASVPGGGDLATVNVYDPVTDAWMAPLPNFTGPRAFHAAWVFNRPADGHDLLCVGGGVDFNSIASANTECYDFTLAAWNAPDADLGALPGGLDWWGMGYANQGGDRLWSVSGIIAGGAVSTEAWYFDTVAGAWVDGGPIATGGAYRTAAATLNGEIYKVSGSTGGFVYAGLADRNVSVTCPSCEGTLTGQLSFIPDLMTTDPSGFMVAATPVGGGTPVVALTDGTANWTMDLPEGTYNVMASSPAWLYAEYLGVVVVAGVTNLPNPTLLGGDFDLSGDVGVVDVTYVASRYGGGDLTADINRSGDVDLVDVTSTASNYSQTAPVPWP